MFLAGFVMVASVGFVIRVFIGGGVPNPVEPRISKASLLHIAEFERDEAGIGAVGVVESLEQVELKSQVSERVSRVHVFIGDEVRPGTLLVSLAGSELAADLEQAEANVAAAQARLEELKRGTRGEERQIVESRVRSAEASVLDARIGLINSIRDAYSKSDDAVRQTADQFFQDPQTDNPTLIYLTGPQLEIDIEAKRIFIESLLKGWKNSTTTLEDDTNVPSRVDGVRANLLEVKSLLDLLSILVNDMFATGSITEAQIVGFKSQISLARTSINGSITALSSANEKYRATRNALDLARDELNLRDAGASDEQLAAQKAVVEVAEAQVASARSRLSKTAIISPIGGIVASVSVRLGDLVNPGQPIVSVVNKSGLQIKAFINSKNKNLIEEGGLVDIEGNIKGVVSRIAPSIDPTTQKVEIKVAITEGEENLIVGQFANLIVDIKEDPTRSEAFLVPLQSVKVTSAGAFVYQLDNDNHITEHEVTLGRVIGESVEIIGGISKDETILKSVRGLEVGEKVELR